MTAPALDALSLLAAARGEVLYYVPPTDAAPYFLTTIRDPRGVK